jgi:hypothetical protein
VASGIPRDTALGSKKNGAKTEKVSENMMRLPCNSIRLVLTNVLNVVRYEAQKETIP